MFFAVLLIASFSGCAEKIKPSVLGGLPSAAIPSQESWGSTVEFSDSGVTKAILKAGHIFAFDNSRQTFLDNGVHVDFFDALGRHSSVLTSQRGSVDEASNNLEAVGNVVVKSDSGVIVVTDKLIWDNARQKIYSDAFVKITSPTEQLQGQGFESDQNLKNYRIFKVTGSAQAK
ncbi:MAG: LPS export ABC transporter periplasmic protein LptC [Ignavibacteriales bacterium]|nr:LPS export ABC transporter periplasmic protein LptC [Ignavibacteriales bacterium]